MLGALSGFAIIGLPVLLGYVVARVGIFSQATGRQLNLLVFYVLFPFMLFTLMATAELSAVFSKLSLVSFIVALLIFLIFTVVAKLIWKSDRGVVVVGALSSGYMNSGNIGIPIAAHLLGDAALAAPIVLFQTCFFTPIGLAILDSCSNKSSRSLGKVVGSAFLKPIVVGSLSGLTISLLPWEPPMLLLEATDLIGKGAIPVMLIAFGMSLRGQALLALNEQRGETILASGLKVLVMPALAWVIGYFGFGLVGHDLYAVTTLSALPTAQNAFNYATRYEEGITLARDAISISTLGSVPVLLLLATLLG